MKTITIREILTEEEINRAIELYQHAASGTFARRCSKEIIQPSIERINAALGQANDPLYLAYAVEYALSMAKVERQPIYGQS